MEDQIYEFRWRDERSPYFRVLNNGGLTEKPIPFGTNLSLEILGMYSCGGYEKNGEYHPCVTGGAPGVRKCEECKKQEGMPIAQYCDGFNTEMFSGEELETLNYPHYLYFALFDKDLVKVGVSSQSRGFLRQIEQGSHYCLVVAEGMWGVPARQMETIIRKNGMIDKVQNSQKKDLFFSNITEEEAKQIFTKLQEKHLPVLLAQKPEFEQYIKKDLEIECFSSMYRLDQAKAIQKPIQETDLLPGESVSGTLIAAKGSFLLLETDADRILLNAKKLKGYQVDFSAKPIGLQKEEAFQGALF
jgi:hypothetical protein